MVKRALKWLVGSVLTFLVLATGAGLTLAARNFEAAAPGEAADYWEYACGVQLPGFTGHHRYSHSGGVYPEVEGLLYYYDQRHHDQLLYAVSPAEVLGSLPLVREHLETERAPDCTNDYRTICERYEYAAPRRAVCRAGLTTSAATEVTLADLERLRVRVEDERREYRIESDAAFRERIVRAKRVWLTFAFEAIYLVAWLSFIAWPLFAPTRLRWFWRVGLAPFLLFLPYFLGYAPMTFTFGPSGGFIYPFYLMLASIPLELLPCSPADQYLWVLLPPVLAPLSQVPGSPSAWSYMSCVGPASSLSFGILLVTFGAAICYGCSKIRRRLRQ